jgi:hypothetical protein
MQRHTHTERQGVNLTPRQIEAADELEQAYILVATMNGNEMISVPLQPVQVRPLPDPDPDPDCSQQTSQS